MKVVGSNVFSSSATLGPRRALIGAVGRALQDLYSGVLQEPLPESFVALARRVDEQALTSG